MEKLINSNEKKLKFNASVTVSYESLAVCSVNQQNSAFRQWMLIYGQYLRGFSQLLIRMMNKHLCWRSCVWQNARLLQILGLDICADTIVGDQMQRGISGGQKKRVTTGNNSNIYNNNNINYLLFLKAQSFDTFCFIYNSSFR